MNNKISSFLMNVVLSVLFVGILFLPAASMGFLGVDVDRGARVLPAQTSVAPESSYEQEFPMMESDTRPPVELDFEM